MIKLQDFASQCGVTDRQVQRLLKKYENDLVGHFERKGPKGTWLDDEACSLLRSKMKVKEIVLTNEPLLEKIKELEDRIERKDVIIERLQEREQGKDLQIEKLQSEKLRLEENIDYKVRAAEDKLKLDLEKNFQEQRKKIEKDYQDKLQKLSEELQAEKSRKWKFPWSK